MAFDPYHKWLGISPKEQPPHHYRLLGLGLYEADADVIDAAANRQMAYVQSCATGKHLNESQQILNELSAARLCLLTPQKKQEYDDELRKKLGQAVLKAVPVVAPPALSSKPSVVATQPRKTANSSPSSKLILISLVVVAGGLGILVGKIVLDKLRPADELAAVQLNEGNQNELALAKERKLPTTPSVSSPSPTSTPSPIPGSKALAAPTPTSTSSTLQTATALKSEGISALSAATATASKPPMPSSGVTSQTQKTNPAPTALPTATSPPQVATAAPISTSLAMPTASPTPTAQPPTIATPPNQPITSITRPSTAVPHPSTRAAIDEVPLRKRLAGTRWINTNDWFFVWDAEGELTAKKKGGSGDGIPRKWQRLGPDRISVFVGEGKHTFIFNHDWTSFVQLGSNGAEIAKGRRIK